MLYDLLEDDTALFLCRYLLYNEDIRAKEKEIWEFEKEYFNTGGFDSSCSGGTFSDHKSG